MKQAIVVAICILIMFYIAIGDEHQLKTQQQTIDSLQTELFKAQSETGRYEITLELLSQENEPAAAQFDSLYNNETE